MNIQTHSQLNIRFYDQRLLRSNNLLFTAAHQKNTFLTLLFLCLFSSPKLSVFFIYHPPRFNLATLFSYALLLLLLLLRFLLCLATANFLIIYSLLKRTLPTCHHTGAAAAAATTSHSRTSHEKHTILFAGLTKNSPINGTQVVVLTFTDNNIVITRKPIILRIIKTIAPLILLFLSAKHKNTFYSFHFLSKYMTLTNKAHCDGRTTLTD